jgi:hypothetical protein
MHPQHCHFCGNIVVLIHVHGHYQCPVCHTNALPCCDGDNCDTNLLLKTNNKGILTSNLPCTDSFSEKKGVQESEI